MRGVSQPYNKGFIIPLQFFLLLYGIRGILQSSTVSYFPRSLDFNLTITLFGMLLEIGMRIFRKILRWFYLLCKRLYSLMMDHPSIFAVSGSGGLYGITTFACLLMWYQMNVSVTTPQTKGLQNTVNL